MNKSIFTFVKRKNTKQHQIKMFIAQEKKQTNIIEYILYMWQIEDIVRAFNFNLVALEKEIISQFELSYQDKQELIQWYDNLIAAMINEQKEEKGHIQTLKNTVNELYELHTILLQNKENKKYQQNFENLIPYIENLITKTKNKEKNIIEILLEALYGILMLKLSKKKITPETTEATTKIAKLLSILGQEYHQSTTQHIEI